MRIVRFFRIVALAVLGTVGRALALDVTACEQIIGPNETGTLVADLTCSGPFLTGVRLDGGTLAMNGFTIRGNGRGTGTECTSLDGTGRPECTVVGPGEVEGFEIGIGGAGCTLTLDNVVVRGNALGVSLPLAGSLRATDVTVVDGGLGIWAQRLRGDRLTVRGNTGDGVNVNGTMRVRHLTATDNGVGVRARHGRLVDSSVLGSAGFDVVATGRLRLRRTTCERSGKVRRRAGTVVGELNCQAP